MLLLRSVMWGRIGVPPRCAAWTPKTVKRKVLAWEAGQLDEERAVRAPVAKNTDVARDLVVRRVEKTKAKVQLLVEARAVGYEGSARNFRRLVAEVKTVASPSMVASSGGVDPG